MEGAALEYEAQVVEKLLALTLKAALTLKTYTSSMARL